jgi:hypothetical protein
MPRKVKRDFDFYKNQIEAIAQCWDTAECKLVRALIDLERNTRAWSGLSRTFGGLMANPALLNTHGYRFSRYAYMKGLVEAYPAELFEEMGIPAVRVYNRLKSDAGRQTYREAVAGWASENYERRPGVNVAFWLARRFVPSDIEPPRLKKTDNERRVAENTVVELRGQLRQTVEDRDRWKTAYQNLLVLARERRCKIPRQYIVR